MNIDFTNTYSLLSSSSEKEDKRLKEIFEKIENLSQVKDSTSARKYVKEVWDYDSFGKVLRLCDCCTLYAEDTNEALVLKFNSRNDNIIFYYNK